MLYWFEDEQGCKAILSVPLSGGTPTVVAAGRHESYVLSLAFDDTSVYWAWSDRVQIDSNGGSYEIGTVMRAPRQGGPSTGVRARRGTGNGRAAIESVSAMRHSAERNGHARHVRSSKWTAAAA
jgi:hypothetical protein